jgi:hypothetical protein
MQVMLEPPGRASFRSGTVLQRSYQVALSGKVKGHSLDPEYAHVYPFVSISAS